jgi:Family of unknown function (DUF6982)
VSNQVPAPSSTRKRVVVRKLNKELVKGYADLKSYLHFDHVELLTREGRAVSIALSEIKGVFFVRDFDGNPQRPERKVFQSRPRLSGLWVRLNFKDTEVLEGLISNNLLEFDPLGFHVTPPDVYSNNLKVFIPRSALTSLQVLGVISEGKARKAFRKAVSGDGGPTDAAEQIGLLFPPAPAGTPSDE